MRAYARGAGLAVTAAALMLAGCGLPDGLDGDLTGAWSAMPEPASFVPEAGTCHSGELREVSSLDWYDPVPCDERHVREILYIGQFTGGAADRVTRPPAGSPEFREAYHECDDEAADYLGADFRHGRLRLAVTVPSVAAWDGGARWFRCDLAAWETHETDGTSVQRTDSLRDALAGSSDLRLGCYDPELAEDGDGVESMNPVACDEPHTTEFAGVWTAPDTSYMALTGEDDDSRIHRGCRGVVAEFVGVPDDADLWYRTSTIASGVPEYEWEAGNRGFRCYLWLPNREVSESLAGAGTEGLPIQYG